MGHRVIEKDLQADPEKIHAIIDMPTPSCLDDLRSF
jgi:hypothetical protein